MLVRNRKEMTEFFESALHSDFDDSNERKNSSYLKTYLIESNVNDLKAVNSPEGFNLRVTNTEDSTLKILTVEQKSKKATLYVDTIVPRYWSIHTLDNSDFTTNFINKYIRSTTNHLDSLWLPNSFMLDFTKNKDFRGFSLKYDDEFNEFQERKSIDKLSMRLWGSTASSVLQLLQESKEISNSIAISNVGLRHHSNGDVTTADLSWWGKFKSNGKLIDDHFFMLNEVRTRYANLLDTIESCWIEYYSDSFGTKLRGDSLTINFDKEIEDISLFLKELLSSTQPFRLWGIHKFIAPNFAKVLGIDLHTGHKINFEITTNWIRIYLPKHSCGNTVLRMLTNIQHYYDSKAVLECGANGINI